MTFSVVIPGGAGYIGSVLVPVLLEAGHQVTVIDRFYFGADTLAAPARDYPERLRLVRQDVRRLEPALLQEVDAVIDLAGISNDPSCDVDPELTQAVNLEAAGRTMELALEAGVKRYIFMSSCSVYGRGDAMGLTEESPLRPVSLYAKCKAQAEERLLGLRNNGMATTILRLATVFGLSPRMRFDLAINVMTKNAYTRGQITVDGGGRQWRPFVHVRDVAETICMALAAPAQRIDRQVFNVGHHDNNVRILNLAYRVRDTVAGTQVRMAPTDPDLRDYNVRFDKVQQLRCAKPFRGIEDGVAEVLEALKQGHVDPMDRRWYTLQQYQFLAEVERLYRELAIDGRVLS